MAMKRLGSTGVKYLDLVLVVFIVTAFVFASPFHILWMTDETPWYVPYLLWLGVIAVTAIIQTWRGRHEL
ncbi:MAG: hypothetical protein R3286_04640 [Gammaproteobacteria bacterium]|nr:hypothetical protein [Gammaproteobacteria bacterium]